MEKFEKIDENNVVISSSGQGDRCVFTIIILQTIDEKFADSVSKRFEKFAHQFIEEIRQEEIWLPIRWTKPKKKSG